MQPPRELLTGESFHIQAEQARERGDFFDALKFTDEASIRYQQVGDDSGLLRFNSALSNLVSSPHPDSYTQAVWVSGAHMHLVDSHLVRGNKEGARE